MRAPRTHSDTLRSLTSSCMVFFLLSCEAGQKWARRSCLLIV